MRFFFTNLFDRSVHNVLASRGEREVYGKQYLETYSVYYAIKCSRAHEVISTNNEFKTDKKNL